MGPRVHPDEKEWAPIVAESDGSPEIRYPDDPAYRQRGLSYDTEGWPVGGGFDTDPPEAWSDGPDAGVRGHPRASSEGTA